MNARWAAPALLIAAGLLSACGAPSEADSGSMVVIARVKDAVGLDPARETDGLSLNVSSEVFANLVRFKPGTFEVVPDIASSWTSSPDGRVWRFHLHRGLRFSDGTPVDAAAVKFNFDRWRLRSHPAHGSYEYSYYVSQFGGYPGAIAAVTTEGPATVTLRLKEPLGPLLRNLAMPSFGIGSPAAISKDPVVFGLRPVASGPYTVAEWIRDDHITLAANPYYSGPKPAYATVIIRDIPDQSTSVLSMQKADISALTDPRPDDAKRLAQLGGIRVYSQPSNNTSYLAMNMDRKPFDNLLVRRAIASAIDIPAIVHGLYAAGAVVADNWTPPGMLGENSGVKAYPHDPALARTLLARAGFPKGFATQLYYPTAPRPYMPEPQRVAEAIAANLGAVGIEVTLQPFEFGVFLQKVRNGEHPLCLIGWTGDNGDPDNFMYDLLDRDSAVKGTAQNYSFWRDPTFHALMLAGQRTIDERRRAAIYRQANAMIHDQVPAVSLVHTTVPLVVSSSIAGVIPNPNNVLQFELWKPRTAQGG
jgi:peptide/nickel transport system substrate-binding protein